MKCTKSGKCTGPLVLPVLTSAAQSYQITRARRVWFVSADKGVSWKGRWDCESAPKGPHVILPLSVGLLTKYYTGRNRVERSGTQHRGPIKVWAVKAPIGDTTKKHVLCFQVGIKNPPKSKEEKGGSWETL